MATGLPSRFYHDVGEVPRAEYPRPQLQRESYLTLNGTWEYAILPSKETLSSYQGEILVPFCPESLLSGVQKIVGPDDVLYYSREFEIEPSFLKDKTILHFDAVDYICTVTLNDVELGTHKGGYLPFSFDATSALQPGTNVLKVTVTDPSDTGEQARGKQTLHPGGIWYTPTSGIWGPVWLESVTEDYIRGLKITPDIDSDTVTIHVDTDAERVSICVLDGETVKAKAEGRSGATFSLSMKDYTCWSPDEPKLYDLVVKTEGDAVRSYFGMRKFSVEEDGKGIKRLFLNNKPLFHNGVLDQGYWSDGLLTAPTDEAMIYDLEMIKGMGYNMVRKHIKIEPLRWYYHADRLGVLVWQDMVSGGIDYDPMVIMILPFLGFRLKDGAKNYDTFRRADEGARNEFLENTEDTVKLLYNTVSIAMWVPFNEGWGQFDSDAVSEHITELDPTRTIDRTSGWHDQKSGDFISKHIYFTPIFVPRDKHCYLLSEYGGYSKPTLKHMQAKLPFGYRIYYTRRTLQRKWKKLMENGVIDKITVKKKYGISAAVYTQLSDVEGEINGLVTYDRKVEKFDRAFMKEVNDRVTLD